MISEQDVLKVLQSVSGPDGKTPLPQTGAIAGLSVKDSKVYLSIAVDPAQAAAMEGMRVAAEKAVRGLSGVANALVSLTAEKAASAAPPRPQPQAPRSIGIPGVDAYYRGRVRQRRRRKIDDDGRSRAVACRARLAHRHSRSRYFRPVAAAPSRH